MLGPGTPFFVNKSGVDLRVTLTFIGGGGATANTTIMSGDHTVLVTVFAIQTVTVTFKVGADDILFAGPGANAASTVQYVVEEILWGNA
jgi:hypothetical protein